MLVRESVIQAVAHIANAADFSEYYDQFMPPVLSLLDEEVPEGDSEQRALLNKSIEYVSILCDTMPER